MPPYLASDVRVALDNERARQRLEALRLECEADIRGALLYVGTMVFGCVCGFALLFQFYPV